jgi:hypothetical protein
MGQIILKSDVKKEPGTLYYCKPDENGCIAVYKAKMARGGRKKVEKKKVKKK